jgi:hypothetical protein
VDDESAEGLGYRDETLEGASIESCGDGSKRNPALDKSTVNASQNLQPCWLRGSGCGSSSSNGWLLSTSTGCGVRRDDGGGPRSGGAVGP